MSLQTRVLPILCGLLVSITVAPAQAGQGSSGEISPIPSPPKDPQLLGEAQLTVGSETEKSTDSELEPLAEEQLDEPGDSKQAAIPPNAPVALPAAEAEATPDGPAVSTQPSPARPAPAQPAPAQPAPARPAPAQPAPPDDPTTSGKPFHFITLIEGSGRYGGVAEGSGADQPRPITEGTGIASTGGQMTWGIIPVSTFTMAARLRGGVYFGDGPALAYGGAAVLLGSTFRRKSEATFSYLLGGLGAEFIPARSEDLLTIHVSGGTVFHSLNVGGDIEMAVSPNKGFFMIGLHLGWGRLVP